jgi:hypothetical protein
VLLQDVNADLKERNYYKIIGKQAGSTVVKRKKERKQINSL